MLDNFVDFLVFQCIVGGYQFVWIVLVVSEGIVDMLVFFGLIFDDCFVVMVVFLVVVEGFVVQVVKWCVDFYVVGGFDICIMYVNLVDSIVVVIDGQCYVVVFQCFKVVDDIVFIGFYFVV